MWSSIGEQEWQLLLQKVGGWGGGGHLKSTFFFSFFFTSSTFASYVIRHPSGRPQNKGEGNRGSQPVHVVQPAGKGRDGRVPHRGELGSPVWQRTRIRNERERKKWKWNKSGWREGGGMRLRRGGRKRGKSSIIAAAAAAAAVAAVTAAAAAAFFFSGKKEWVWELDFGEEKVEGRGEGVEELKSSLSLSLTGREKHHIRS